MTREELRRAAADCGLGKLDDKHLDQFGIGQQSSRALADRLPKDLHWTEENALIFSLVGQGGRR